MWVSVISVKKCSFLCEDADVYNLYGKLFF